jgi:hypothetical protein
VGGDHCRRSANSSGHAGETPAVPGKRHGERGHRHVSCSGRLHSRAGMVRGEPFAWKSASSKKCLAPFGGSIRLRRRQLRGQSRHGRARRPWERRRPRRLVRMNWRNAGNCGLLEEGRAFRPNVLRMPARRQRSQGKRRPAPQEAPGTWSGTWSGGPLPGPLSGLPLGAP